MQARGRGRIPSINETSIQDAVRKVYEAGHELTMNGVAEDLGVNVTTLYRHTGGLEGLREIYAHQISANVGAEPSPENKSWQLWLQDLAGFYRAEFLRNPDLLRHASAALDPKFERLERITGALLDYGFEPRDADNKTG